MKMLFDVQIDKRGVDRPVQIDKRGVDRPVQIPIQEKGFHVIGRRNFTKIGVTDLFTRCAKDLFPSSPLNIRYIQLATDSAGIPYDARFFGFTNFNDKQWKPYLLPLFTEFRLKPCAIYQIYIKPSDTEIVEITEASLAGIVKVPGSDFTLVEVDGKGLVAVTGCYYAQARVKLVRRVFIEVSAPHLV